MTIRKVALMGNPVLRQKAKPVPEKEITSPSIQALIHDMIETMYEYNGRGLAAPQIHESLQIIVLVWDFDSKEDSFVQVLINPKIKDLSENTSTYWEGCLSLPELIGKVSRPNRIMVEALNEKGKPISFIAEKFAATVVQHEVDHLKGTLYIDRVSDLADFAFTSEYQKHLAPEEDSEST